MVRKEKKKLGKSTGFQYIESNMYCIIPKNTNFYSEQVEIRKQI